MFWVAVGIVLVLVGLAYLFDVRKVANRAGRYRREIEPHLTPGGKPSLAWYVAVERWGIGVGFTVGGLIFVVTGVLVAH